MVTFPDPHCACFRYGFNAGSTNAILNHRSQISAAIAINTTISAAAATISTLLVVMLHTYRTLGVVVWDLIQAGNGTLTGLAAITGPCAFVPTWGALIIGAMAGVMYYWLSRFMLHHMRVRAATGRLSPAACTQWHGLLRAPGQ